MVSKSRNEFGGGVGDSRWTIEWESSVDPGLWEELQHLRRLPDVKGWLNEMVAPGSSSVGNQRASLQKVAIASDAMYGPSPLNEFIRLTMAREYNRLESRRSEVTKGNAEKILYKYCRSACLSKIKHTVPVICG